MRQCLVLPSVERCFSCFSAVFALHVWVVTLLSMGCYS